MDRCVRRVGRALFWTSTVLMSVTSATSAEPLPKKGVIDATYTAAGTGLKEIGVSGDDVVYLFESTLLMGNNPKTPLMQNISAHCLESGFTAQSGTGYCVYTDKDGDKFVEAYSYVSGATSGKGSLSSGTGKFKGIQGKFDWQQVQVLPAEKGAYHYVGKKTGTYQLP